MRFVPVDQTVIDTQTGLQWLQDANLHGFPQTWREALAFIGQLNSEGFLGHGDWRLPNRREFFSLLSHEQINPALPEQQVFRNVFTGYYWTSTTCARLPAQAWTVHLGGARVVKGMKQSSYMVWPVRTAARDTSVQLLRTGQHQCYGENHAPAECVGAGQDGDLRIGRPWPHPRFDVCGDLVADRLSGLIWSRSAALSSRPLTWFEAQSRVAAFNQESLYGCSDWRLPSVREFESLCDMGRHGPALPAQHPFEKVRDDYWTATTSRYDPQYAWVLYLIDGNVGVGFKSNAEFYVWPVRTISASCGWCRSAESSRTG